MLLAVLAVLGGVGARLVAGRRFQGELAEARQEMDEGLLALARKRLTRLAEQRPDDAEVAYRLGSCEAGRGRPEAAIAAWDRIPTDSPWAAPAALEHAQSVIPLGRIAEAERVLNGALRRPGPEVPALRHLILILLGQQGRIDEARRLIESLWDDATIVRWADVADRLAMLREHAGLDLETFPLEWNSTQLEGVAAPTADEDRRSLALARAYLAIRSGDFERAEGEIRSCLERWPNEPTTWKSRLDWAVAADRIDPARDALAHVPARLVDPARIAELRAWFARHRPDTPAERRALEDLVALDPGRTDALTRLAELLQQSGDPRAAELRSRKSALDGALDRYIRLYRENRYADRLPELAELAERLGRGFEARAFRELIGDRRPTDIAAKTPRSQPVAPDTRLAEVLRAEAAPGSTASVGVSRPGAARGPTPVFEDRASESGLAGFIQDNGSTPNPSAPRDVQRRGRPARLRRRRLPRRVLRPGRRLPSRPGRDVLRRSALPEPGRWDLRGCHPGDRDRRNETGLRPRRRRGRL